MRLEELQPDATVCGILPDAAVSVINVEWHGSEALTLVYRGPNGRAADEILYRHDEPHLELLHAGRPWSFDGDGALFRLVSQAYRIAYLDGHVGTEVSVTLEIDAKLPNEASDQLVRIVTENSRTLKFESHGFEKE